MAGKGALSLVVAAAIGITALQAGDAGVYIGAGYASTTVEFSDTSEWFDLPSVDFDTDSIVLLAGYDFNAYIGVEGRYYWNLSSGLTYAYNPLGLFDDYEAQSLALYAKPQYDLDMVAFYALLGFTMNSYTALAQSGDETLFSWGGGAKLFLTESFAVFADYTYLGESDLIISTELSSWNFGLIYKF
jgi:hypothetical protein